MQTAGLQPDHRVTWPNPFSIQHPRFFHHPHNRPADVVFAGLIKPWHLGGLATDQRTAVFQATANEPLDNLTEDVRLQFSRAELVEDKERFCAQHRNIIYTMTDPVLA